jgi:regulator of protease activity HflC (stomatin/prohibitin superfamily)
MIEPTLIWAIIVLLIALSAIALVKKGIVIVPQAEARVVERLGKYHRTLYSGVNYIVPGLDKTKKISWEFIEVKEEGTAGTKPRTRTVVRPAKTDKIDLREHALDFPAQDVITKDNVTLEIDALLFFQVIDPKRAVYEIDNLPNAIEKLTQTSLRSMIGELELDDTLASRDVINQKLTTTLDDTTDKWGVKINRVEIQTIEPPEHMQDAMEQQMRAERKRRADILEAEGTKKSNILSAEGEAEARLKVAQAEADAIKTVAEAVKDGKGDPTGYLLGLKYIEALKDMVKEGKDSKQSRVIYMPYEATGVLGSLGTIREMLSGEGTKE